MGIQNAAVSVPKPTPQSTNWLDGSVREKSTSTISEALHAPRDAGAAIKRAREVLQTPGWYTPDWTQEEFAKQCVAYGKALKDLPAWAVSAAFDEWVRTRSRAPSPGDIRVVAARLLAPFGAELARRKRMEADNRDEEQRAVISKERAREIMEEMGFTEERAAAVKRFPTARTAEDFRAMEERQDAASAVSEAYRARQLDAETPEGKALRAARDDAARR